LKTFSNEKTVELQRICKAFINKHKPRCEESVYQVDSINQACPELVAKIFNCIGYYTGDDESKSQMGVLAEGVPPENCTECNDNMFELCLDTLADPNKTPPCMMRCGSGTEDSESK
jgi:hypothetical protein